MISGCALGSLVLSYGAGALPGMSDRMTTGW